MKPLERVKSIRDPEGRDRRVTFCLITRASS
jgi:hypothetical protein